MINTVSFKSKVIVDVGGSIKENSCKINILNDSGNDSYTKLNTTVNNPNESYYKNNDDFVDKIANRIKQAWDKLPTGLHKNEKQIKDVVLFMPGNIYENKVIYAGNIRNQDNSGYKDLNFNNLLPIMKEKGIDVGKDTNIKLFQDTLGVSMCIAKTLNKKGMLTPGSYYSVIATGGGCGISNIRCFEKNKACLDVSGSAYFSDEKGSQKVSRRGANVSSLIKNFCNTMQMDKKTSEKIAKCGFAKIVTQKEFELGADERELALKNILLNETDLYELSKDGKIKLTENADKSFEKAKNFAIEKYVDAISRFALIKETEGSNGIILTGVLATALDKTCRQDGLSLSERIENNIEKKYNTLELDLIKSKHDFKIIINPDFSFKDNTQSQELALNAKYIGENRYNWISVDLDG